MVNIFTAPWCYVAYNTMLWLLELYGSRVMPHVQQVLDRCVV